WIERSPPKRQVGSSNLPVPTISLAIASRHDIDLQHRISRRNARLRQTKLATHDITPLRDCTRLVERDLAIAPLPSEAAIARYNQAIRRDVLQRFANLARDVLGSIGLQFAMAYCADRDLLLQIVLEGLEEIEIALVAILHLERPDVAAAALEINLDRVGVAGIFHDALQVGVAPTRVNPDLDIVEPLHFAIVCVDHELHFRVVLAERVRHEVEGGLLDLDAAAPGIAQCEQFLVHRLRHVPDDLALVLVVRRVDIEEERHDLRAAGADLGRLGGARLRQPPDLGVIERAMLDLALDVRPSPSGVDVVEQRAGRIVQPRRGGLFRLEMIAFESGPALQRIV